MDLHWFLLTKALACVKKQRFCGSPRFLQFFGVFGWKGILEFLTISFRLLILFGIGLPIWHPFGALHMVCLMEFL